jgi:hypothetical protein
VIKKTTKKMMMLIIVVAVVMVVMVMMTIGSSVPWAFWMPVWAWAAMLARLEAVWSLFEARWVRRSRRAESWNSSFSMLMSISTTPHVVTYSYTQHKIRPTRSENFSIIVM